MSSVEENKFKPLLLIGSLIGMLGAIALIIGMIIQFEVFSTDGINVFGLVVVAIAFGIFIICLLTLFGTLPFGFQVNDERPGLLALTLFIFAPTIILAEYTTPLFYLLDLGNGVLETATPGFAFYLVYIGTALFFVAFIFHIWTFLWKSRQSASGLNLGGDNEIVFTRVLRIITSILILAAGAGVILGLILPAYSSPTDPNISGLMMYEDGSHIDLQALFLLAYLGAIVITAIIVMLSNFGVVKSTRSEIPLLALLGIIFITPSYVPKSSIVGVWSTPIYELLVFLKRVFVSSNLTVTVFGWILTFSIIGLIISFFLALTSYFFSKTATADVRTPRARGGRGLEARKKKGKFPSGPPSASAPPSVGGDLASQLSSSGPPAAMSGPSTGQQPTISSEPPTPPSFMPTATSVKSSDNPTCPFCGKALRFIDEYQRWYCDGCSQYV